MRSNMPQARLSFVDSFAPNDLRLGAAVDPYIDHYLKKSLLRDRSRYLRPTLGDTNIADYYNRLYDLDAKEVDWGTPDSLLPKLRLSPNFHTAPRFLRKLAKGITYATGPRRFDVQTRLGSKGTPVYSSMRTHAMEAIKSIDGLRLSPEGQVSYEAYMAEMEQSLFCFSPFGYGELCWRDIEGICTGSVMIKQDMSHLESLPDIYEAGVTYAPIRWDFADLPDVIENLRARPEDMKQMARTALARLTEHVQSAHFIEDIRFLFDAS